MNTEEKYLDKLLEIPNKEKQNKYFKLVISLIFVLLPLNFFSYYSFWEMKIPKASKTLLIILLLIFLFATIIVKILVKSHPLLINAYALSGFLIYCLNTYYFACKYIYYFFISPLNIISILLSFVLFIIISTWFAKLIINKVKSNDSIKKPLDNILVSSFIGICVILGRLSAKYLGDKLMILGTLIMSYIALLLTIQMISVCMFVYLKKIPIVKDKNSLNKRL